MPQSSLQSEHQQAGRTASNPPSRLQSQSFANGKHPPQPQPTAHQMQPWQQANIQQPPLPHGGPTHLQQPWPQPAPNQQSYHQPPEHQQPPANPQLSWSQSTANQQLPWSQPTTNQQLPWPQPTANQPTPNQQLPWPQAIANQQLPWSQPTTNQQLTWPQPTANQQLQRSPPPIYHQSPWPQSQMNQQALPQPPPNVLSPWPQPSAYPQQSPWSQPNHQGVHAPPRGRRGPYPGGQRSRSRGSRGYPPSQHRPALAQPWWLHGSGRAVSTPPPQVMPWEANHSRDSAFGNSDMSSQMSDHKNIIMKAFKVDSLDIDVNMFDKMRRYLQISPSLPDGHCFCILLSRHATPNCTQSLM